ncbi:hypothetical protein SRIMM317S_00270 [Streptomyces rimosus subsp. rimosus]
MRQRIQVAIASSGATKIAPTTGTNATKNSWLGKAISRSMIRPMK